MSARTRWLIAAVAIGAALSGCTPSPISSASQSPDLTSALHVPLTRTLPRSASFARVEITIVSAEVTNVPPLSFSGEPTPGPDLIARLDLVARNPGPGDVDYDLRNDAFQLRTYSGQLLAAEETAGINFSLRPAAGGEEDASLYFFVPRTDALEGAVLLIGRQPDAPAFLPLTGRPPLPAYPAELRASSGVAAGEIRWTVLAASLSQDLPAGICCPETGSRANEDELFLLLAVRGTVEGSKYGQASVTSSDVIMLVDGTSLGEGLEFNGRAGVPEGESYDIETAWVIPADAVDLVVQLGSPTTGLATISLARAAT